MITMDVAKNCSTPSAMMDRVARVISFYGFVPFDEAPVGERAVVSGRIFRFDPKNVRFVRREERRLVSALRAYAMRGLGDRRLPAFLFKFTPEERDGRSSVVLELHVVGIKSAAAEALLITVADAIAAELGIEKRSIALNGVGVGDSAERYTREVTSFLRKHIEHLSASQRERMHNEPLEILLSLQSRAHPILARVPSSMDYLNEDERRHFWDVLEYLELAGKTYELNPTIVGSSDCWAHTLFEMSYLPTQVGPAENDGAVEKTTFAIGGRYDSLLGHSLGPAAAAVCVTIAFELKNVPTFKKPKGKPSAYLAHLGNDARRKSIPVLELLRGANVPVYHSLAHDQLSPQMAVIKSLGLPWLFIIGQKEASADEIAVRNIKTNVQDTMPVTEFIGYLKRKRIAA